MNGKSFHSVITESTWEKKANAKPHNYKMFSCERNTTLLVLMMSPPIKGGSGGWSVPVLLFPGNQQLVQLLQFVFVLTHWCSLDVQLSPQSGCFVLQLLLPLQLRRNSTSFTPTLTRTLSDVGKLPADTFILSALAQSAGDYMANRLRVWLKKGLFFMLQIDRTTL